MFSSRLSRGFRVVAVAAALTLTSASVFAQEAKPAEASAAKTTEAKVDPKAKAVLDRYIEVTGGKASYEKVKSRTTVSGIEIVGQGITGTVTSKQESPDKILNLTEIVGIGVIEQGLSGDIGWSRSPMDGLRLLEGPELQQLRFQASADQASLEPEKFFTTISYVGEVTVDGKPAEQVDLDGVTGKISQIYDKASGLLVQMKMVVISPQGEVPVTTTMSDYKEVDGIKMPHSSVGSFGPMQIKTEVKKVESNPTLPAETFKVPDDVKALAEKKK